MRSEYKLMAIKPVEIIELHPWLDATEKAKFEKGEVGVTSDRWKEKPSIEACWRGVVREWNIKGADSYQSQCWCPFWKTFINPSGFTCELCKTRNWPDAEVIKIREKLDLG